MSDDALESRIKAIQGDLRGYIVSLCGHGNDCDDILQETNIFLWERRSEATSESNIKAWAFKVAYFRVMATRRDRTRRGEVNFSEAIIQRISGEAGNHFTPPTDKLHALGQCLKKLKADDCQLLQVKYLKLQSLAEFASQTGKSAAAVHKTVSRLRHGLKTCIESQLSQD